MTGSAKNKRLCVARQESQQHAVMSAEDVISKHTRDGVIQLTHAFVQDMLYAHRDFVVIGNGACMAMLPRRGIEELEKEGWCRVDEGRKRYTDRWCLYTGALCWDFRYDGPGTLYLCTGDWLVIRVAEDTIVPTGMYATYSRVSLMVVMEDGERRASGLDVSYKSVTEFHKFWGGHNLAKHMRCDTRYGAIDCKSGVIEFIKNDLDELNIAGLRLCDGDEEA